MFSDLSASIYINRDEYLSSAGVDATGQLLSASGNRVRAVSGNLGHAFGNEYYVERSMNELINMSGQEEKAESLGIQGVIDACVAMRDAVVACDTNNIHVP